MPRWLPRAWFGATALVVVVGIVVQLSATYDSTGGFFDARWERVANVFVFFTIQSNIAVGIGCGLLAVAKGSSALWFRSLRLLGTIAIALTFLVYHAVLRDLQDLTGEARVADVLLHSVVPVMALVGWVWFGPRGLVDVRAIAVTIGYLLVWGSATLIRGEAVGFYPYPFMDPSGKGYGRVALNLVLIGAAFVAMGLLARWADERLRRKHLDAAGDLVTR